MATLDGNLFNWRNLRRNKIDCPICGSSRQKIYDRFGDEAQYSYMKCLDCSLIFQNPRFEYDESFLKWAYDEYGVDYIEAVKRGESLEKLNADRADYYRYKADLIAEHCGNDIEILDVGASCGQFLYFCKQRGFRVFGLETSARQVEFLKDVMGYPAVKGTTDDMKEYEGRFDVVHCAHTLEHVPDPVGMMTQMKRLLRPRGWLFLEVPNVRSFNNYASHLVRRAGLSKNTWKPGDFPEHLVEFSPRTFRELLDDSDVEVKVFRVHSRSVLRKGAAAKMLDRVINSALPVGNNMIAMGRVESHATE